MDAGRPAVPLSRREREVAALVADGLTDREIGKRLFISERTAESHVQQIRNKLGLDNRAQVASWFTRQAVASAGAGAPAASPAPGAPVVRNLPTHLTRFIGRDRDLSEIRRLLQHARLLTITGPGGCGKTRLAVEAVGEVIHRYPGGAWFVDVSSVTDPTMLPLVIAQALGLQDHETANVLDAIAAELRDGRCRVQCLVLLDNCEHMVDPCASAATTLLAACPQLSIVSTSRERLHVPGETVWTLEPLALPPAGAATAAGASRAEAVRLFVDRASLADPAFALDDANAGAVVDVCRQLDGIPLALELAAARAGLTPIEELRGQLKSSFGRLRRRGVPSRQQTMHAAIDWSHQLLDGSERRLYRCLAVFRAGFTLEAARAVCGGDPEDDETFAVVEALQDKSLLMRQPERRERFRLLEPVRQHALERLSESGELDAVAGRHLAYYSALADRGGRELAGPAQAPWLARLGDEHDNLRAALELSRTRPTEERIRLALALTRFWRIRGHLREGRAWLEDALAAPGPASGDRAGALNAVAGLAWLQGDVDAARAGLEASLAAWREIGDEAGTQGCLANLGVVASTQSDWERGVAYLEEGLLVARRRGDDLSTGIILGNLGVVAAHLGDHDAAGERLAEAERVLRRLGDAARLANALANLGLLAVRMGRTAEAAGHYAASLRLQESLREPQSLPECLEGTAWIAVRIGHHDRALRLGGAAAGLRQALGAPHRPWSRAVVDGWLDAARAAVGETADVTWSEGMALTVQEAIALASEECAQAA